MTSPSPLATAFVVIRPTTAGFGPALKRDLDSQAGVAGASGAKAGKSWSDGFQKSGIVKTANRLTEGIIAIGAVSVVAAVKFQSAMERIHTQAGVAQKDIKGLGDGVLRLAGQVGFSPDSLATSLYHVESSFASLGITGPKALNLVKIAAEGAKVGGANLEDVTNALTALVAAGLPGVKNMSEAMGVLNATVGAGDMKMQDLADAFGTGLLASVKGFGVSITDVGAALATFGDNNIRGAKAGSQLRMAIQALAAPTSAGAKNLISLGISSGSLAKAMQQGGLRGALEELVAKLHEAGYTTKQVGEFLTSTFGKRAGVGIQILTGQMTRFQSKFADLSKGAGQFSGDWKKTQQTVSQQLDELGAGFAAVGVKVGDKLLPPLISVMNFARNNTGVMTGLAIAIGTVAVAITTVSVALKAWEAATEIAKGLQFIFTNVYALAATTVIATGLLIYSLRNVQGGIEANVSWMAKQDKATGLNVAGYNKLSQSAADAAGRLTQVQQSTVMVGQAAGHALALQNAYSGAQQTAARTAQNLQQSFATLGSEYKLNENQVKTLIIKSGALKDVLAANGRITPGVAAKIDKWAMAENHATGLTNAMSIAVNALTGALDKQAGKVLTLQGNELAWRSALQQANAQLKTNNDGLKGNSSQAIANKQAVLTATEAVVGFAKQQLISKGNLGGASKSIQDQISWLKSLKDHTGFTSAEIKILVGWLRQIKSEQATIKVSGTGSYSIVQGSPVKGPHAARGLMVTGGVPGKDSVPIMAQRGELVVPTSMVKSGAVDHLRGSIPGFAGGGVVGSYGTALSGLTPWLRTENTATLTAMENSVAQAVLAAIRAARVPAGGFPGAGTPGGGSAAANAALARRLFPWPASQWPSFNAVEMREAGYSMVAQNPTSGAYGMAQFINGPSEYYQYGGNPNTAAGQLVAMFNYIRQRYGTPAGAWAHELSAGWYDKGGVLKPGLTLAYNGTGRPEMVVPHSGRGGGGTTVVNVYPPVTTSPVQVAKEIADILNHGARAGIRVRKSLVSNSG